MLHKDFGTDLSQIVNYFNVMAFNRKKHKLEKRSNLKKIINSRTAFF